MRSLYWAFYGYLQPVLEMLLVAGDAGPPHAHSRTHHYVTHFIGELIIGIYHVVIIIVLLNLMISLFVSSADSIMVRLLSLFVDFWPIFLLYMNINCRKTKTWSGRTCDVTFGVNSSTTHTQCRRRSICFGGSSVSPVCYSVKTANSNFLSVMCFIKAYFVW